MSVAELSITAYEVCSALGLGRAPTLAALSDGRSGLGIPALSLPFETVTGRVAHPFAALPVALQAYETRLARLTAWLAAGVSEAVTAATQRWGPSRVGLFIGTSTAGIAETETAWATLAAGKPRPAGYSYHDQHAYHSVLAVLRGLTGIAGPGHVTSTACSSSGKVFASAARLIRAGIIDAALVGGVDVLCQTTLRGFFSLGALSATACRPFSAARDGINIGEGGALLLLERGEGAALRLRGVGESSDAHHMSAPHPGGRGARAAMAQALAQAQLDASAVSLVNAHGTGTKLNDAMEAHAIAAVLGGDVPVVSTKPYTGHLLGAAGAVEAVLSAICLEAGLVPAGLGLAPQDPACAVNVASTALHRPLDTVLSNSFAFGGNNVSVLLQVV